MEGVDETEEMKQLGEAAVTPDEIVDACIEMGVTQDTHEEKSDAFTYALKQLIIRKRIDLKLKPKTRKERSCVRYL
jgi:hypothetical protein